MIDKQWEERNRPKSWLIYGMFGLIGLGVTLSFVGFRSNGCILHRSRSIIAKAEIHMMCAAVKLFKIDTGQYPERLEDLARQPVGVTNYNLHGYLYDGTAILSDPWDNSYRYHLQESNSECPFRIVSYGSDGAPGGEGEAADIYSVEY